MSLLGNIKISIKNNLIGHILVRQKTSETQPKLSGVKMQKIERVEITERQNSVCFLWKWIPFENNNIYIDLQFFIKFLLHRQNQIEFSSLTKSFVSIVFIVFCVTFKNFSGFEWELAYKKLL